jgi:hypothetical protein
VSLSSGLLLVAPLLANQVVRVEIASPTVDPSVTVEVQTTWLGEARSLALRDDGSGPTDDPADGLYAGRWEGAPVWSLPIRVLVTDGDRPPVLAYEGVEQVYEPEDRLSYLLDLTANEPRVERVVAPASRRLLDGRERSWVAASLGWACLALLYAAFLAQRAFPRRGT